MSAPFLSLITVSRNAAPLVVDCVRSVHRQRGFAEFGEHLLVDGASSDNTCDLVAEVSGGRTRIHCEPDRGLYDGMNKGVSLAHGQVVGFLNADDFFAHDRVLEQVCQAFEEDPSLDLCYSGLCYVDRQHPERIIRRWPARQLGRRDIALGLVPPHPTVYLRKSLFLALGGFDLSYRIAADNDLLFRALYPGQVKHRAVEGCWIHMREGGLSNRSLANVYAASCELRRSMGALGMRGVSLRLAVRYLSKLLQYLPRRMHAL